MASVIDQSTIIEIAKPDGTVVRHFPITKLENIIGMKDLTDLQAKALKLLAVNSYMVDDETGKTYKIGITNGKIYAEESEISVKDLVDTLTEAITPEPNPEPEEGNEDQEPVTPEVPEETPDKESDESSEPTE